jgi:hypothetical protein
VDLDAAGIRRTRLGDLVRDLRVGAATGRKQQNDSKNGPNSHAHGQTLAAKIKNGSQCAEGGNYGLLAINREFAARRWW